MTPRKSPLKHFTIIMLQEDRYYDNTYKDFTRNNFAYNDNTYNT